MNLGLVRASAVSIDILPIAAYVCDRSGVLTQYNERAAELWGRNPALGDREQRFGGALRVYRPDGVQLASDELPMAEALRTGKAVRDRELIVEKPNGERITVIANVNPTFDEDGNLTGGVNCFQDVTELRKIQNEQNEGRHVVKTVLDAIPSPLYATDADGYLTYYNPAAVAFWGFEPELQKQRWCGSWKQYDADGNPLAHDECPMAVAIKEKRALRGPQAIAERPDGTRVPFMPYPTPIFGTDGKLVGAVNLLFDLTEIKRAEAQQKTLIDELNHRVKNTLATVQSLAAQSFRGVDSENSAKQAFESRLFALSKTHDHLTRERWEWADFNPSSPMRSRRIATIRSRSTAARFA
jgi:PAS domain-containing protein